VATTLSVAELITWLDRAVLSNFPAPVWIKGESSGYRRTNRGAVFFRLVDPETADQSVEVSARGRVIAEVERDLAEAGVGSLRSGIEIRLRATVGLRRATSVVQLSLLEVDPTFTAGRLALDRDHTLQKLKAEGLLDRNRMLDLPLVPLRIGLVTSRGSAAYADFLSHLARPGYRFSVSTVEAMMQGEGSAQQVDRSLERLAREPVDLVALVRGGGSKLDLSTFDAEAVGRRIAAMPVPVITGIGHETDRSIADEVSAVSLKTPTAVAEWIVARVAEYAGRIEIARRAISDQARDAVSAMERRLDRSATQLAESKSLLIRQEDLLAGLATGVAEGARRALEQQVTLVESYKQLVATVGIEPTLRRGFALVSRLDGSTVRAAAVLSPGEQVRVRLADGSVSMTVDQNA